MLDGWLAALEAAPIAEWMRLSSWAYPAVNSLHVIGIALLFGAIVPLDLRLIGWRGGETQLLPLSRLLLPCSVAGFVLAAGSGALLFTTDARQYTASTVFQIKLALIGAALLNALILHSVDWRAGSVRPARLRLAATLSILLWVGVIGFGRWIAYA